MKSRAARLLATGFSSILLHFLVVGCVQGDEKKPAENSVTTNPTLPGYDDHMHTLLVNFHLRRGEELEGFPTQVSLQESASQKKEEIYLIEYRVAVPVSGGTAFETRQVKSKVSIVKTARSDGKLTARYTLRQLSVTDGAQTTQEFKPDVFLERPVSQVAQ